MNVRPFPDGVVPAVALDAGRGWMAVRDGDPRVPGWLILYGWTGTDLATAQELQRWGLGSGTPCFPNLHVFEGLLWQAWHDGHQVHLLNVATGSRVSFDHADFDGLSNPMAFGDRWFAFCEPAVPYRVHRVDLVTGEVTQLRLGAPTGLSRITPAGDVITVDEDRLALPGATIPSFAGDLAVGEGASGGVRWRVGAQTGVLWFPLDSFTPDCAEDMGVLAICTGGSGSVRLFCGTLEDLQAASVVPPDPIVRVGRRIYVGFFAGSPQAAGVWRTDTPPQSLPGNCYLDVATLLVRRKADDQIVAQYVASEGAGPAQDAINLVAAIRAAKVARPGIPVLAYWTRQSQAGPIPAGADIVGVEAYWDKADSLATVERKLRAALAKCPAAIVLAQTFTGNPGLSTDLAALVPVYARVALDCTSVIGVIGFNGSGRATGLQDHPEIRSLWEQLAAGVPGVPAVSEPPHQEDAPVFPKIDVKTFGEVLVKGQPWEAVATIGDTQVIVRIGGDGNLTFRAKNPAGEDATGRARHVEVRG